MRKFWSLLCIAILLLTTACSKKAETAATTSAPTKEEKQVVAAFGIVKANNIRNITMDFSAMVEQLHVKEGDKVVEGQALVDLNTTEYQNQIKDKEYQLNIAKRELEKLQETVSNDNKTTKGTVQKANNNIVAQQKDLTRLQQELGTKQNELNQNTDPDIKKAVSQWEEAQRVYAQLSKDLETKQVLCDQGAVSKNELEQFKSSVDAKQNEMDTLKLTIDALRYTKQKEINTLEASINEKNASVKNYQVELGMVKGVESADIKVQQEKIASLEYGIQSLKDKLAKSYIVQNQIVSDVKNGVVYEIGYKAGDIVNNEKKVLSLMDLNSVVVEANVSEEFIKDVKLSAPVVISPIADASKEYKGSVVAISDMAVKQNGETVIPVQIAIENMDGFLRPNFNVNVDISK
jgi:multidrug resistance efflux pump